jgi:hypothetical protein
MQNTEGPADSGEFELSATPSHHVVVPSILRFPKKARDFIEPAKLNVRL